MMFQFWLEPYIKRENLKRDFFKLELVSCSGGIKFYERAEIKDAVSYYELIKNLMTALERVIGVPKGVLGKAL